MCTEVLLAIIYFSIIMIINFFLFKLLKTYLIEIKQRQKIKQIFSCYSQKSNAVFPFLYNSNTLNQKINKKKII